MLVLDPPSDVTTSQMLFRFFSSLFFQKRHQAGDQGPESQDGLSRHQLIMITAQEVFLVFEKGFDLPADRQHLDQLLDTQIQHGAAPIANGLQRLIRVMAGDQDQGGSQLANPAADRFALLRLFLS